MRVATDTGNWLSSSSLRFFDACQRTISNKSKTLVESQACVAVMFQNYTAKHFEVSWYRCRCIWTVLVFATTVFL